jgi:quercetin dioxygenase-like cupin family protein
MLNGQPWFSLKQHRHFAMLMVICSAGCAAPPHSPRPNPASMEVSCEPADGRQGELGCWVLGTSPITAAAGSPVYWHVYEFSSQADAERARDSQSAIVPAYGRTWLMAVTTAQNWSPSGGRRVAIVGPLQPLSSAPHSASYMEATFTPGMRSRIHTHPGPEAWIVLEGEQCLETPEGNIRVKAGESMMVRGGIPMALFGTGQGVRRALVVIVHPTGERLGKTHSGWQPTGSCLLGRR